MEEEIKKKYEHGKNPNSLKNLNVIKPGEVRNPLGGAAHDPTLKAIKRLTKKGWEEILHAVTTGTANDLKLLAEGESLSALQRGVALSMYKAVTVGDWALLKDIVETLVGKAPMEINFKGHMVHTEMSNEQIRAEIEEMESKLKLLYGSGTTDT